MCGIAGIVGPIAEKMKDKLRNMLQITKHRGPDDSGEFYGSSAALGHNRLAIIDLSKAGRNPMFSPDKRYAIIYNGEVFNYKEIKDEIGSRYPFSTSTDTEVVLAAFTLWGIECVDKFIGMFAFAIWDRTSKELYCFRDRFGIKPFYYTIYNGHLYFSSEIKALFAAGCQRYADYSVIFNYLKWGQYECDENTFFKGIKRIMPGHTMVWKKGDVTFHRYWDMSAIQEEFIDEEEASERVFEVLQDCARIVLRSDVPVGVNLSGGLDSSALVALLDSKKSHPLEGFTQDYRDKLFSERPWVEEMAQRTKRTVHFTYMSHTDFQSAHQALNWYQDEPYGGAPVAGYVGIYQNARCRDIIVLIDGNGLDEALSGYRQYHNIFLRSLSRNHDANLDFFIKSYAQEWGVTPAEVNKFILRDQAFDNLTAARDGTKAVEVDWLNRDFVFSYKDNLPKFNNPFKSALKNAMYQDVHHTKIPRTLRFNDRVSMAFSCELRVPFLDHRLFEICFSLPDKILFTGGRPKGLLRKMLGGILPDRVRLASKRHIQTPQSEWFTERLRPWIADVIASSNFRNRNIIDAEKAFEIFREMEGKAIANSFFLWQAINLETWFIEFIDSAEISTNPVEFPKFSKETVHYEA